MACSFLWTLGLRSCTIMLIMHIWRSFSLKFNYHLFTTVTTILDTSKGDLNFFLPILYSFYLSVYEKLYWHFGKPQLEIPKRTRLSIVHSLRVRVMGKLHFNSQTWVFFHFNAACSLSEDQKVGMKLIVYNALLFWRILLFVLISLNNLCNYFTKPK